MQERWNRPTQAQPVDGILSREDPVHSLPQPYDGIQWLPLASPPCHHRCLELSGGLRLYAGNPPTGNHYHIAASSSRWTMTLQRWKTIVDRTGTRISLSLQGQILYEDEPCMYRSYHESILRKRTKTTVAPSNAAQLRIWASKMRMPMLMKKMSSLPLRKTTMMI